MFEGHEGEHHEDITHDYNAWYQEEEYELSAFGQKGSWESKGDKGKGKGKGYGQQYWTKGNPKGGWKGGWKGEGKGEKGKGKGGKGGFQGVCHWCGKYGHSQRFCPEKDEYMQWVREKRETEGRINSSEEEPPQSRLGSFEQLEQHRVSKGGVCDLCSLVKMNRYYALQEEAEE